jgi:hypothetical protein
MTTELNLSIEEISRIVAFLGYGNPSAPVWFVGIEEGLGNMNSAETLKNLKARGRFESTMDLRDAHLLLEEGGQPIEIQNKRNFTPVWEYMSKIMLARSGKSKSEWQNLEAVRQHVRHKLGRANGETFLTELSPIPSKKASDKTWMALFKSLDPELCTKIKDRQKALKVLLGKQTKLVICYGKRPDEFANLFDIKWHEIALDVFQANDPRFLLLPFFGVGNISHSLIGTLAQTGHLSRGWMPDSSKQAGPTVKMTTLTSFFLTPNCAR